MQIISWDQGYAVSCVNNKSLEKNSKRKNVACMLAKLLRGYLTNVLHANASQFIDNNRALMEKKLIDGNVFLGSFKTF